MSLMLKRAWGCSLLEAVTLVLHRKCVGTNAPLPISITITNLFLHFQKGREKLPDQAGAPTTYHLPGNCQISNKMCLAMTMVLCGIVFCRWCSSVLVMVSKIHLWAGRTAGGRSVWASHEEKERNDGMTEKVENILIELFYNTHTHFFVSWLQGLQDNNNRNNKRGGLVLVCHSLCQTMDWTSRKKEIREVNCDAPKIQYFF